MASAQATGLLAAAMRGTAPAGSPPDLAALAAALQPQDWAAVRDLAAHHEVESLIWHALRETSVPPALARGWRERYYRTGLRNDALLAELAAALDELAPLGIRPILLKGIALAPLVYGNLALRPMSDIDLLLRRDELAAAWAVFSARGYLLPPASARYWRLQFRNGGELRLIHRRTTALVELHWWLFAGYWSEQAGLLSANPWPRAEEITVNGRRARRLHRHDEILHLAHHLTVSNQCGPGLGRMLVDLDRLIGLEPPRWPLLYAEARRLRLATALWLALELAARLLGTPIGADSAPLVPAAARRTLLLRVAPPAALLAGHNPQAVPARRALLLLLLLDRPVDMAGLVARGIREAMVSRVERY